MRLVTTVAEVANPEHGSAAESRFPLSLSNIRSADETI